MTNYYYGMNRGGNGYSAFSVATSTTGKEMEFMVNGTNVPDKETLVHTLEQFQEWVEMNGWPPV